MPFWVSLNELHFRVGVLGSMKIRSAFTGCYSEPGMWFPICPAFQVFVEKTHGAERREAQGERSESFSPSNSITFLYLTQI